MGPKMTPSPQDPVLQRAAAYQGFLRWLFTLRMLSNAEVRIQQLTPEVAVLRLAGQTVILVAYPGDSGHLVDVVRRACQIAEVESIELVLIGGPASARQVIEHAIPERVVRKVLFHHVNLDQEVWHWSSRETELSRLLAHWSHRLPRFADQQEQALISQAQADAAEARQKAVAFETFARPLRERKPRVTHTLLVVIGAVYVLQLLWGNMDAYSMFRMGSLEPHSVAEGQWWRVVSCTFLHGGAMHLMFNGYVLLALGDGLERIVGSSRFLVLYCLSGLGGSMLSLQFVESQSVGASGAIWGLLGAYSVLVLKSPSPMPVSLRQRSRKAVLVTLAINIGVSFLPFVDAAAHFGGGITGALLMASPLYRRGLPVFHGDTMSQKASPPAPIVHWLAAALAVLFAIGLGLGLTAEKPWIARTPPIVDA